MAAVAHGALCLIWAMVVLMRNVTAWAKPWLKSITGVSLKQQRRPPPWRGRRRRCSRIYLRRKTGAVVAQKEKGPGFLPLAGGLMAATEGQPAWNAATFDTDSKRIFVDNCALVTVTNSLDDVVRETAPYEVTIGGYGGGKIRSQMKVTVQWHVLDDRRMRQTIQI